MKKSPLSLGNRKPAKKIPLFEDHERFLKNISVDPITDCWNWTAGLDAYGYGKIAINTEKYKSFGFRAHRVSWDIFKGGLRRNLVIDHKCKNRRCCNPDHLRQVTNAKNTKFNLVKYLKT